MPNVGTSVTEENAVRRSPEDRVVQAYIGIVAGLGTARTTAVEYAEDGVCIWTVIDAEPGDREASERIYEAELLASMPPQTPLSVSDW